MTRKSGSFAGQNRQGDIAGIPTKLIVGVVLFALALWFLLANLNSVKIQFWVFTVTAPLWIALAATLLIGAVIGYLFKDRREGR
ncbi:LapA family protein [Kitasatospora kifunensis]|uniref:Putative integral membrane protein n=1 Tax=Kitasatospora kifunensis TaxID=58351 RepID=A0A7W7QY97_KITKI|nr:LapA family protein [Kitasatospora kifunensis]MBB4921860.1 putative integral membrane protein [Kitasatospora kifunensis]